MSLKDNGFTLIELMIAVAILLIVITGLLATLVYCILLNESSNNLVIATGDAQYILEQIKGLPYNDIANYTAPSFSNLNNETITLNRNIGATISEITVAVHWNERQRQKSHSITTRIAK
jgi:prepilin-type N-terminal cleavage/methylation domain-containing protein